MESSVPSLSDTEDGYPPFRFFDLPSELRLKILAMVLHVNQTIDIGYRHRGLLNVISPVSRKFYNEAYAVFFGTYGGNTFRLFPTHFTAMRKSAQPLPALFTPHFRAALVSLELRLGTFWTKLPPCWKVDDALGLEDMQAVRVLRIFVEIDPSGQYFKGFRKSKDHFTNFAGDLLKDIIKRLPCLDEIRFDGNSSVSTKAPLMTRLLKEARNGKKRISSMIDEGDEVDYELDRALALVMITEHSLD